MAFSVRSDGFVALEKAYIECADANVKRRLKVVLLRAKMQKLYEIADETDYDISGVKRSTA